MTYIHSLLETINRTENEKSLSQVEVEDIEFSGGTYLVKVLDHKKEESFWPFLQVSDECELQDCFCSCDNEDDEGNHCIHILKAIKCIGSSSSILHKDYYASLWYTLSFIYMERLGVDPALLNKSKGCCYQHSSASGKLLFKVEAFDESSKQKLQTIVENREPENEENSIKFSNISAEDLQAWKEGHPSTQLKYELSFWGDLAKYLIFKTYQGEDYKVDFEYAPDGLPNYIHIQFTGISTSFYLPQAILTDLIPTLSSINCALEVASESPGEVKKIHYNPHKQVFTIDNVTGEKQNSEIKASISIGSWYYVPQKGFYYRDEDLLSSTIGKDRIAEFLEGRHLSLNKYLEKYKVEVTSRSVSYKLKFDEQWNLHLLPYLFEKGDIQLPLSQCFGRWVFIEDKGFYKVEDILFEEKEPIIPCEKVGDFVNNYRFWLNNQKGFSTRLTSIETKLRARLTDEGDLLFESYADLDDDLIDCMDFGEWVYINDHGFYAKLTTRFSWPVRAGARVPHDEVSNFINKNKEDLEAIDNFFFQALPLTDVGIKVEFQRNGSLLITPTYLLTSEFKENRLLYFGRYVYLEGKGFCELPPELQLPGKYSKVTEVAPHEISDFIKTDLEGLRKYTFDLDSCFRFPKSIALVAEKVIKKESKSALNLQLNLVLKTDLGRVNIVDLWKAQQQESEYLLSPAGLINVNELRFSWLKKLQARAINAEKETLKLSLLEFLKLNAFEEIHPPDAKGVVAKKHGEVLRSLKKFSIESSPNLEGLKSTLRAYQEIGLRWLWFLYENHLSGLLCDDMGLGKTHQAMALLASVANLCRKEEKKVKYLVVCPTSVIYHWQEKLNLFFPQLRVYTFYGSQRDMNVFEKEYDLLLTSYGILRLEKKSILSKGFEVSIFDEIQIAKNYQSQVHRVVSKVKSRLSLGLTGTPIENNLRELKSLFDLVLPSYMPNEVEYKTFFMQPIEKFNDAERKELLSKYVRPFIMRRKKSEVLEELPEKTEELSHCSLSMQQKELYKELLNSSKLSLMKDLENKSQPVPYIHIFALLTRLKQVCNHPSLAMNKVDDYKNYDSGKWQLFVELLSQARESAQKVVVFSQFLGMLDIMQMYLKEMNISYAMIRGDTQNRGKQLEKFSHDPKCEVFLGSLGAVGLGVDLTAASVVIHYDRWWNAARENQATDRVHRIGQQRGVQVFKLVTKDTLEEKIDQLISRKGQLMEDVIGSDDHTVFKTFSREEIMELLQFVEKGQESIF